jgi:hypothetical protein
MSVGWIPPPGLVPVRKITAAKLDSSGAGTDQITNPNSAALWVIQSLSLITVPTSNAQCVLTPPTGVINTSYFAGTGDLAEGPHFLYHGDQINLAWSSGPANGQGICTYEYYEVPI